MKKLTMIALSLLALAAIGCSNTGSNNGTPANTNMGVLNAMGQCTLPTTGQIVSASYCNNNLVNGSTQQCFGQYYYLSPTTGQWLSGMCNGQNCSGYTLYTQAGIQVRCL